MKKSFGINAPKILIYSLIFVMMAQNAYAAADVNSASRMYVRTEAMSEDCLRASAVNYQTNLIYQKPLLEALSDNYDGTHVGAFSLTDGLFGFDGSNCWRADGLQTQKKYLTFDFEDIVDFNEIDLYGGYPDKELHIMLDGIDTSAIEVYSSCNLEEWLPVEDIEARELLISHNAESVENGIVSEPMQLAVLKFPTVNARYVRICFSDGRGSRTAADSVCISEVEVYEKEETSFSESLIYGRAYSEIYPLTNSDSGNPPDKTALTDGKISFSGTSKWLVQFSDANKKAYAKNSMPYIEYTFDALTEMNQYIITAGKESFYTNNITLSGTSGTSGIYKNADRICTQNVHIVYSEDGETWTEAEKISWQNMERVQAYNEKLGYKTMQQVNIFTAPLCVLKLRIYLDEGYGTVNAEENFEITSYATGLNKSYRIEEIEIFNNTASAALSNSVTTVYSVNDNYISSETVREKSMLYTTSGGFFEVLAAAPPYIVPKPYIEEEKVSAETVYTLKLLGTYTGGLSVSGGSYTIEPAEESGVFRLSGFDADCDYIVSDSRGIALEFSTNDEEPIISKDDGIEWEGIYDYNVNNNLLFGMDGVEIKISNGECTDKNALIDGYSTSANGAGSTKWYVQYPSGEEYVEFVLPEKVITDGMDICSLAEMGGVRNILEQFSVQMYKDNAWITLIDVTENESDEVSVRFDAVEGSRFRIYITQKDESFRIREVSLNRPDVRLSADLPAYVEKGNYTLKTNVGGDYKSAALISAEVDGMEFVQNGGADIYSNDINFQNTGISSIRLCAYDENNRLITFTEYSIPVVNITENMNALSNAKSAEEFARLLLNTAADGELLGFDTAGMLSMTPYTLEKLADILMADYDYSSDYEGASRLFAAADGKLPVVMMNAAQNKSDVITALENNADTYGIDIESDELTDKQMDRLAEFMLDELEKNGEFDAVGEIGETYLAGASLIKYNDAYALSLPEVFEKYTAVCEISLDFISSEYLSQTLLKLKTYTVTSYKDIPALLSRAYESVKETAKGSGSSSGSSSGSGSGSGSGGYGIVGAVSVPAAAQEENNAPQSGMPVGFGDLDDYPWAADTINRLAELGIISGMSEGVFEPGAKVTRAQFVTIICGLLGEDISGAICGFADVPQSAWYYNYVAYAYQKNLISGKSEEIFEPDGNITREEMFAVIYRVILYKDITLTDGDRVFDDEADISPYAAAAVKYMLNSGIITGNENNCVLPKNDSTRAEAAVAAAALLDRINAETAN